MFRDPHIQKLIKAVQKGDKERLQKADEEWSACLSQLPDMDEVESKLIGRPFNQVSTVTWPNIFKTSVLFLTGDEYGGGFAEENLDFRKIIRIQYTEPSVDTLEGYHPQLQLTIWKDALDILVMFGTNAERMSYLRSERLYTVHRTVIDHFLSRSFPTELRRHLSSLAKTEDLVFNDNLYANGNGDDSYDRIIEKSDGIGREDFNELVRHTRHMTSADVTKPQGEEDMDRAYRIMLGWFMACDPTYGKAALAAMAKNKPSDEDSPFDCIGPAKPYMGLKR